VDYLDTQLQQIQDDNLQEFIDPLIGSAVLGTGYLIGALAFFLWAGNEFAKSLKIDKKLSKRINEILGSGNKWIVHIYPSPTLNAFALGMGRHIFVTDGLKKTLNQRELEAVMLHEIHHNKSKDTYKSLAYKHSFFYLITYITLISAIVSYPLAVLVFAFLIKSTNISHNIILGKRLEIKADKFTVEYGYGKDLVSALLKLEKHSQKAKRKDPCGKWCQLENKVSEIIDEHPSTKKRVEVILRKTGKVKGLSFVKIKDFIEKEFKQNG